MDYGLFVEKHFIVVVIRSNSTDYSFPFLFYKNSSAGYHPFET